MRNLGQFPPHEAAEQVAFLRIAWFGGGVTMVGDKETSYSKGRIKSFSGIQSQKTADNKAMVSKCSVTLDDYDDWLKTVVEISRVEGSLVTVFCYMDGISGTATDMMHGKISAPIVWNEGERTLSFDIVSVIETLEVGYAPPSDMLPQTVKVKPNLLVHKSCLGKVWPMVFGKCAHVPAQLVQRRPQSKLVKHLSFACNAESEIVSGEVAGKLTMIKKPALEEFVGAVKDDMFISNMDTITIENTGEFEVGKKIQIEIANVVFEGTLQDDGCTFKVLQANVPKFKNLLCADRPKKDKDFRNPKVLWLKDQNTTILGDYIVAEEGSVSKTIFKNLSMVNVCVRQEGNKCWFKYPFYEGLGYSGGETEESDSLAYLYLNGKTTIPFVHGCSLTGLDMDAEQYIKDLSEHLNQRVLSNKNKKEKGPFAVMKRQLDLLKYVKSAFWKANIGTPVRLWGGDTKDIFVCNSVASKDIISVYGLRKVNNKPVFQPVPSSYYTKVLNKATNIPECPHVTTIEFSRELDSYGKQEWDRDALYVSVKSTIGSNTADQLRYIISNYTSMTPESVSFDRVRSQISGYPSNFALFQTHNALDLAEKIAWQARCALIVDSQYAKIKYLSVEPVADYILNEANTLFRTIEYGFTDITNIKTVFEGVWRSTYAPNPFDKQQRIRMQNNVDVYGVKRQTYDFFIYNDYNLVAKSMAFWSNRQNNSWRLLKAKTCMEGFGLEVFDTVLINNNLINSCKAIVDTVKHNIHDGEVELELWMPIVSGTITTPSFVWPPEAQFTVIDPTKNLSESNYIVTIDESLQDLEEVKRELHKLVDTSMQLGRVVAVDRYEPGKLDVVYYSQGPFGPPDSEGDYWTVYTPKPHEHLKVGDWVQIQGGQDGVNYAHKIDINHLGYINSSNGNGSYEVSIIHTKANPVQGDFSEDLPAWASEYNIDKDEVTEEVVTAFNLAELNKQVDFVFQPVPDGTIIYIYHQAGISSGDTAFWWFNFPIMLPKAELKGMIIQSNADKQWVADFPRAVDA